MSWKRQVGLLAALTALIGTATLTIWSLSLRPKAEQLFREAQKAALRAEPDQAIGLLDRLLSHYPNHAKGLLYRGQLAAEKQDFKTAREMLNQVQAPAPEAGTAKYLLGAIQLSQGYAQLAERDFKAAIELHPEFLRPRESLLQLFYIQARSQDAEKQLHAIRTHRPWNIEELFSSQLIWFESCLPIDNVETLLRFVETDSGDTASRLGLAKHFIAHGQQADAINLLDDINGSTETRLIANALRAECYLSSTRFRRAWQSLRDDPMSQTNPSVWWRAVGRCAFHAESWPEAATALRQALKQNPNDYEALYQLGIATQQCGDDGLSQRLLTQARNTEKLATAAGVLLKTSRERQDVIASVMLDVAKILVALDRPTEAGEWLSRYSMIRPNDQEALNLISEATADSTLNSSLSAGKIDQKLMPRIDSAVNSRSREIAQSSTKDATSTNSIAAVRLNDISPDVGLSFEYFNGAGDEELILNTVGGGVAVIDFDGDSFPDLFFPNGCPIGDSDMPAHPFADQLWRNLGGRETQEVGVTANVAGKLFGQGCTAVDFNNDGFQDLFVANYGEINAYQNLGDGTFLAFDAIEKNETRWNSSLGAADFDRDGDLDVYSVAYLKNPFARCRDNTGRAVVCSPANFEAEQDQLFINQANGAFRNRTEAAGIIAPNGKGLGLIIADFDGDSWQDIYVANDGEQNFLFRNITTAPGENPQFSEVGLSSGASVSSDGRAQAGMGIACGDFGGDGHPDLYVTNFFEDFNTLYVNRGNLLFSDETKALNLAAPTMSMLGFGTQAVDFNLDGTQEILVANGHIHDRRFEGTPWKMNAQCFQRSTNGQFKEISADVGPYFQEKHIGRGVAQLDFNCDHKPDAVIANQSDAASLLLNSSKNDHHAVILELRGTRSNRDAIGAKIEINDGTSRRLIEQMAGDGYYASNHRRVIVGIGDQRSAESIVITWPSGHTDQLSNVPADKIILIVEDRSPLHAPEP